MQRDTIAFCSIICLRSTNEPNQSMKPTAPLRYNFSVFATKPPPWLISFSLDAGKFRQLFEWVKTKEV